MIEFGTRISEDGSELLYFEIMDGLVDGRSMKGADGRNKVLLALTERHHRKEAQRIHDELLRLLRDLPARMVFVMYNPKDRQGFGFGEIGCAVDERRFPTAVEALEAASLIEVTPPSPF